MNWNWKEYNKEKTLFKSYYCVGCRQRKPCQLLTGWDSGWKSYCCACYSEREQEKAQEYLDYQLTYQKKVKEKKEHDKQLKLLRTYAGCPNCQSKEVDAYELYDKNKLVCQPCLMKKTGGASGPISFSEQEKWYKKYWGIDLGEWLENYDCLPVNADCARKWQENKEHLSICECLELETKNLVEMFTNSLKKIEKKLEKCSCVQSEKTRTPYYDSENYGYTYCEKCEATIKGAGKHGVIKNRNNPSFWGLECKEKVLCGNCLEKRKGEMKSLRRAKFNEYKKLGRL